MKMKTKDKIVLKAIELFNRDGVEKVTTLFISKEMGISLGNLHYHYPNRDELIKAIVDQFLSEMEELSAVLLQEELTNFLEKAFYTQFVTFRKMWKYRFLFADRLVIARRMDYLEIHFKAMLEQRKKDFDVTVIALKNAGLMRSDLSQKIQDVHFQQLVIWNNSWINYANLFDSTERPYLYFAEQSIWTWFPYLDVIEDEIQSAIDKVKKMIE